MSDYPPIGKELKALKIIKKKVDIIRKLESEWETFSFASDVYSFERRDDLHWGITEGHALEGVRCNGTQDTTTIVDIILGSKRILDDLPKRRQEAIDCFDKLTDIIAEILDLSKEFIICPKCEGLKGEKISLADVPGYASYVSRWQDCERCKGRGVILEPQG